jgi:predicted permease
MGSSLRVEGYQAAEGEEAGTLKNVVSPDYFQTLGIPILLGREFEERDRHSPAQIAVVNEEFVRRYVGDANPLGRRLSFSTGNGELDVEIVGVARDQKVASLREELRPLAYTPYWQENESRMTVYLQSNRDEANLGPDVRRVVSEVDANLPVFDMETVASRRRQHLDVERSVALLSAAFAGIATLLAAIGLYGLMAYGVARRTREIGVRMALGAERRHVVGIVLREAVVYLAVGLLIGVPVALGFGRLLESQLFGLSATDPLVLGAAALTLAAAVLFATLIPARRAVKVDPTVALRYE